MAVPAGAVRPATSARSRKKTEPADDGLLRALGRRSVSGLQYVGETLSKPSRALWGTANAALGGDSGGGVLNLVPFSDAMGLTDPGKGIQTSQFLEERGVIPKNVEGFDFYDIPRFTADVIGDPLTYVGGVGTLKSLGKGGSVLAKASKLPSSMSRVGRMTTTVGELAPKLPADALRTAVTRSGFTDTEAFLARHGSEPVGGLASLNMPFGGPIAALGTGKTAQKIGGALDKLGSVARYGKIPGTEFSPGQQMARVFSPSAKGLHTPEIDQYGQKLYVEEDLISRGVNKQTAQQFFKMYRGGAADDTGSMLGRMYMEGVIDDLDLKLLKPELRQKAQLMVEVLGPFKKQLAGEFARAQKLGVRLEHFGDPAGIDYFPREFIDLMSNRAHGMPREEYLRGIIGGTEHLRKLIHDPKLHEGTIDDAMDYFNATWAPKFVARENEQMLFRKLVHRIRNVYTPQQLAAGGFGRNSLLDAKEGLVGSRINNAKAEAVTDAISDVAEPILNIDRRRGDTMQVWDILEQAGLDAGVARPRHDVIPPPARGTAIEGPEEMGMALYREGEVPQQPVPPNLLGSDSGGLPSRIETGMTEVPPSRAVDAEIVDSTKRAKRQAKPPARNGALYRIAEAVAKKRGIKQQETEAFLHEIGNMEVPLAQAEDIVRLAKGDDIKTQVGALVKLFDSFTNLFKVGVLTWPARYVRDHTSGQLMNMLTGNWSPKSYAAAQKLIAGGVDDFTDVPLVRQLLEYQGLPLTPENSTDVLRQILYTHEIYGGIHGVHGAGEMVGPSSGVVPGQTSDFVKEFVGLDELSVLRPKTLLAGSTVNPLKVRGVGGNLRTENYAAATGERIGRLSDGLNRIVPFIENLKKGVAPEQAKEIVDAIQVSYAPRSFTAAERKYLKRAFPFYAFQSRISKTVIEELLNRPGGGIGQAIRAANAGRDDDSGPVPEQISSSLSISLGQLHDGSTRYLTGLGLMHEAALEPFSAKGGVPDVAGIASDIGAKTHPLAKLAIETATGRSLFQRRDLDEMDPAIGRTLSNLGLRETLPSGKARPFISPLFENTMANTPLSRLLTTARTLSDPRKREATGGILDAVPGQAAAMNLLTGLKVSDVSPQVRRGILIDQLSDLMKSEGAQAMETIRFRRAEIEAAEKRDPLLADRMRMLNSEANKQLAQAKASARKQPR